MRVLTVVGARPQFIKAGPVSHVLRRRHEEILVHTGQHYDPEMSDRFFEELGLPRPDVNLGVGSGPHGAQTGRMLAALEDVMVGRRPDRVLVYGDTNSTLAAALAAVKLNLPVAHVEAGLRSGDRRMPEEINRVVTDHVSDLCLCPTEEAVRNLEREGIVKGVHLVGDVMLDAMLEHLERARTGGGTLRALGLGDRPFVLATVHRAENTDDTHRLRDILEGLAGGGLDVVLPLHPRTRHALEAAGIQAPGPIHLLEPAGYLDMLALEARAVVIATDSGGVQKEAYVAGRPCVTMRETTEWTETVDAGWNVLVGADRQAIAEAIRSFRPSGPRPDLFGDGHAAERLVAILEASTPATSA